MFLFFLGALMGASTLLLASMLAVRSAQRKAKIHMQIVKFQMEEAARLNTPIKDITLGDTIHDIIYSAEMRQQMDLELPKGHPKRKDD